ncbi:DUF4290 domain-containing protein [Longibacter salinarum]|uniref:DUF4290 domain-containing protein n=1 Tax=Longibacter salinarum TaxID=1850348 RepID=A0A2A8CUW5_9BACT|nr:DUF4290 domain-containing protein [Longibacter salinarum]PEN12241.1 DUF4290 domain-containing protein [Longibacter salinarum]
MRYDNVMVDRQVGRNAELFSRSIADLDSREERYPYLRILVSLVEQAHPEWKSTPTKDDQVTDLVVRLSDGKLDEEEVKDVLKMKTKEKKR